MLLAPSPNRFAEKRSMKKLIGCFLVVLILFTTSCENENWLVKDQVRDKVSRAVDSVVTTGLLPGVSVYVSRPAGSFTLYKGFSDLELKTTWQAPLPGYAQSISKSFTATAILQLQERGKLNLDDAIKNYLDKDIYDKVANGTTITIRQLLNHTSGILDYIEHPDFAEDVFSGNVFPYDYKKSLSYVYNQPPLFSPGTDWSYSNTNYLLLALIIDKAAGTSNGRFIKENILDKLKLKSTFYLPYESGSIPVVNAYLFNESTKSFEHVSEPQYALTKGMIGDDGILTTPGDLSNFTKSFSKLRT
jgi:D-alanyl-D-alanine carboxypeptidase